MIRRWAPVLLLLAVACGGPETDVARRVVAQAEIPAPVSDAAPAAAAAAAPAAAAAVQAPGPDFAARQKAAFPDLEPGQVHRIWGEMLLEMTLEPSCATVGTPMRAVIRTVPGALVGGAVRYSDGAPHEDMTFGRVPTGEWVWTWTIKPTVPKGLAEAYVTAGKSGESGGAIRAAFEVAERC